LGDETDLPIFFFLLLLWFYNFGADLRLFLKKKHLMLRSSGSQIKVMENEISQMRKMGVLE
jgi:hypothetical protein